MIVYLPVTNGKLVGTKNFSKSIPWKSIPLFQWTRGGANNTTEHTPYYYPEDAWDDGIFTHSFTTIHLWKGHFTLRVFTLEVKPTKLILRGSGYLVSG